MRAVGLQHNSHVVPLFIRADGLGIWPMLRYIYEFIMTVIRSRYEARFRGRLLKKRWTWRVRRRIFLPRFGYLLLRVTRCLPSEDIRILALFRAPPPRLTIARPSESPGVLLGAGGERKFVCLRTEDEDISDKEIPKMGRNVRRGTRQVHLLLSRRPWNLAYVEI